MEWTADVSAGDWLRERIDEPWRGTMHDVVPRGFEAYVRIFHPATRDRPVGMPWPGVPYGTHRREWEAFHAANPEIDVERVSWADTAIAIGTTMHATAQWNRIVAPGRIVENEDGPRDAAGWRYTDPEIGELPTDLVPVVADHLLADRAEGELTAGFVALWEGSGGLVGFMGESPSRVFFQFAEDGSAESGPVARHNEMLGRSTKDRFNDAFRQPTWQEGILSREISEGPRLELPERSFVLFRGDLGELTQPDWVLGVPWRDRIGEEHGFDPTAKSPSIAWPDDRSWVLVSEVDYDSTIVGGPAELIRRIAADPRLETSGVATDTVLSWDSDEVNR
jgi:hypothetical protein